MRHILFLLFMAFTLQAIAQYPATGNKMRLGWQTTGDGLVYRGAIADTATLDPSGINNAWMLLDTANGNLYAYRAKAWQLVSGGGGGLTMPFNSVTFNVNETDASLRELKYSEEKGYLQYGGQDSVQIPLLPGIWYVRNDTSVAIPKGTVLRATGTLGASGRIKVKHMIANGSIDAMYILGIAMHDIAVGADGYAMSQGKIRQVNTQAYSEGAVLYADVDTLGGLTQTEPGNGFLKLPIAFVVHSASNGVLAVRVTSGAYMRDLHDTEITSPVSNASLYYNATEGIWRDTTGAVLTSDTAVFARDFQISGTANYLAKFTGSNAVGNSIVTQNGRSMYINSTQDNSGYSFSNAFQFNGFGSSAFDQPSIGVIGNVGTTANHRPYLSMYRSAGSTVDDKTLVPYNYHLGSITWQGADGNDFQSRGAEISAITDSITGVNDMPTALFFGTTANGQEQPTERMRITSSGNVGIGTASPGYKLSVAKYTSGTTQGEIVQSIIGNTVYSTVGQWAGLSLGTYADKVGIFAYDGYNNFGRNDLVFAVASGGNTNPVTLTDEKMRILNNGNVGIATSSPSRPLHVAGTTAIRIPVGTTSDRGTSANGDIRYNTTNANFEWYSGTGWREPVNAARSPNTAGLANRFSKFDANGLLDTSAVLIQANGRIGIWNTPAASDSVLTVTGGGNFSGGVSARNYTLPTTGNRPALGMYSRIANRLSFTTNDTLRFEILASGTATLSAAVTSPTAPSFALNVNGGGIQAKNYLTLNGDSLANSAPQITVLNQDVATSGGYVVFQKRRGSSGAGSVNYGAVVDGDELGTFAWGGKIKAVGAGGGINVSAGFRANVAGTVTDTFAPVDFTIFTSPRSTGIFPYVPIKTDRLTIKPSGRVGINTASPSATLHVNGNLSRNAPKTVTTAHTVDSLTNWIICDGTGAITLTLPTASSWTGREIMVKTIQPYAVNSASSNVVPIDGVAAGTPILPATDGAWCTLVSDGMNWIIMQRGS